MTPYDNSNIAFFDHFKFFSQKIHFETDQNFQIPRLPTGIAYFVRIKVLGKNGKILVETPEIRARNEMVSIKCESGWFSHVSIFLFSCQ